MDFGWFCGNIKKLNNKTKTSGASLMKQVCWAIPNSSGGSMIILEDHPFPNLYVQWHCLLPVPGHLNSTTRDFQ